jgi:hypothetical protein
LIEVRRDRKIVAAMNEHKPGYTVTVVREPRGPGHVDVALVRSPGPSGVLRHKERGEAVVLAHRTFRPMLELAAMEAYAAQLERVATHANEGTFGCFVEADHRDDGIVRVALYERSFDGERLRVEELARRDFDATEPDAVVSSAEFLTELQAWAAERNEQREAGYLEAAADDRDRIERATERAEAGRELAQILERHNTPADAQ